MSSTPPAAARPTRHIRSIRQLLLALTALALALATGIVLVARGGLRPNSAPPPRPRHSPSCQAHDPCLTIMIDDLGRRPARLKALLQLPLDITYAVLPHATHTPLTLAALQSSGREYWLHLPLEPHDARAITDEQVVLSASGAVDVDLLNCLTPLPGIAGISSHMGSAFTEDRAVVDHLMAQLRPLELPFLDSKTSAGSVVCAVARARSVPCIERDVFLDDPADPATVDLRLQAALQLARRRGWAVAIGHPERLTIEALRRFARSTAAATVVRLSGVMGALEGAKDP